MNKKAARAGRPKSGRSDTKAAIRAVRKGGFLQGRPWRYVAVIISAGGFYHESTKVRRHDYVFWVNMDEREYTLTFTGASPFDSQPMTIVVPAKEKGDNGNWGISDRYRVRQDAGLVKHSYDPTATGWNGPPDPPDISVGG